MRSLFSILIFFCCCISCFSQNSFKGRLVSALTGKPAKFTWIEKDGKLITDTDSLGYFSIEADSASTIELSFTTSEMGIFSIGGLRFKKDEVLLISFRPDCDYSPQKDIKDRKVKFLMIFNAFSRQLEPGDRAFEKKYKVTYYVYGDGCTGIVTDCIETYNKLIGEYLDKKYGKVWRKEVNEKVLGL